ncbi:MAG: M12 family metallo-peptidase [Psychroflexus maritimus]
MKLKISLLTLLISVICFGQSRNYFQEASPYDLHDDLINYSSKVKKYDTYFLNVDELSDFLAAAPNRFSNEESSVVASFPDANGNMSKYLMYEASSFSDELKAKFPNIKTYVGKNLDQKATSIRITITPQGFYGYITGQSGSTYINPMTSNGEYYMVFNKSYATNDEETRGICELSGNEDIEIDFDQLASESLSSNLINDSYLRKYRLALACTSQYANFHLNEAGVASSAPDSEKLETVQAAMAVSIDRVNQIYERDFSVTLEFVDDNEDLIQLSVVSDPYSNNNGGAMLGQNQTEIDNEIGSANYDIGHVFSTGGGGIAALGSVCSFSSKAQGVTGLPSPVGDAYDVDYVCHEIGHQFGATHTQNNNCQRTSSTAMETGSGNTIMGYAGICPPNVQNNSDDHFHFVSVFQVENTITGASGNCAEEISIANNPPTLTVQTNHTIPYGTAFFLDAEATDNEGDDLTYNWEQLDPEVSAQPPQSSSSQGPNFKSFPSTVESIRFFPRFETVLSGSLSSTWEVIPNVSRTMDFSILVRDNNIVGGQSASDVVTVNVANVGPFEVTTPSSGEVFGKGEQEEITWNVAGTTANGINASQVDIFFSTDAGQNFEQIADNVPNNGSYLFDVPEELETDSALILIQAADQIFYAVSPVFSVSEPFEFECSEFENTTTVNIPDGEGNNQPGQVLTSTIDVDVNDDLERLRVGVDISHTYINDLVITLIGPNGQEIVLFDRECNNEDGINVLFSDDGSAIPGSCPDPLSGIFSPSNGQLSTYEGGGSLGTWTLEIQDFWNQDTGTLNSWYLEMCGENLSINEEVTSEFSVYPNPSNGTFNLRFSSGLDQNAKGRIYDINGRLIQTIDLGNQTSSTEVQLENASSGIYLVEIENNGSRTVEKLIVR